MIGAHACPVQPRLCAYNLFSHSRLSEKRGVSDLKFEKSEKRELEEGPSWDNPAGELF